MGGAARLGLHRTVLLPTPHLYWGVGHLILLGHLILSHTQENKEEVRICQDFSLPTKLGYLMQKHACQFQLMYLLLCDQCKE